MKCISNEYSSHTLSMPTEQFITEKKKLRNKNLRKS